MTRGQMLRQIKVDLNDLGLVYYSESDINESIQDGYDEIVVYSQCLEKVVELQTDPAKHPWVNMRQLVPDYYRTIKIFNHGTRSFVYPNSERQETDYRLDWQLWNNSRIDTFIINGPEWIAFPGNILNSAPFKYRLYYKATAPILANNSDSFKINNNFLFLLRNYCVGDLLEQNQEFSKAAPYWAVYDKGLEDYRYKIQLLSKSDRVFVRG